MKSLVLIASIAHAVNAAYCASLGDMSQPGWDDAPDWQKASAIDGVQFHLANPDAGDSASHENWMKAKEADGWVYGETKDPEKKTHPCMVPFDQLPPEQQFKDRLFRTIVHAAKPLVELEAELQATGEALDLARGAETQLREQLAGLTKERDAAERKAAKIAKGLAPAKPRKIAAMSALSAEERVTIGDLVAGGETVSIVFTDGKRELTGIAPIVVSGPAFNVSSNSMMLRDAVDIRSNDVAGKEVTIEALALFDSDGGQLAFKPLPSPIAIAPGRTYRLERSIEF